MTLLAPIKLIPRPPALVVKIKIKIDGSELNESTITCLDLIGVVPSNLK